MKGDAIQWLTDPEYAALRHRLAAEAVASAWHSRALVCPEVCRIGERMEPAATNTQAERERVYSVEMTSRDATTSGGGLRECRRLRGHD